MGDPGVLETQALLKMDNMKARPRMDEQEKPKCPYCGVQLKVWREGSANYGKCRICESKWQFVYPNSAASGEEESEATNG